MKSVTHLPVPTGARMPRMRPGRGVTLVELLVVVAVVGALMSLVLPAVQATRESARVATCRQRLRQVAFATLQFETAWNCLPPARIVAPAGNPDARVTSSTWLIRIMPFIGAADIASRWDETLPYVDQDADVQSAVVTNFLCPTRRSHSSSVSRPGRTSDRFSPCGCIIPGRQTAGGALADFGGNHGTPTDAGIPIALGAAGPSTGTIVSSEPLPGTGRWRDRVRLVDIGDGVSRTLLIGEMHVPRDRLQEPPDDSPAYDAADFFGMSRVGGVGAPIAFGPDDDAAGMGLFAFGSWHHGGCHVAFVDGRVDTVSPHIDSQTLDRLCHRDDSRAGRP